MVAWAGSAIGTGGDNIELRQQVESDPKRAGVKIQPHPIFHGRGNHNICNRGHQRDLQPRLTPRLRLCPLPGKNGASSLIV
ncbi:hypothetical protein, partial [Vreelandella azerica]|uniref:hypothetical protein n=1 Tax=Vreelandella azerica TaxID=2732867 RepID=UPI001C0FAAF0